MEVHHFLTLYLTSPTVVTVDAVQGDSMRVIAARLMAGAEPWQVPEGVTAGIGYELPGKTGGYYDRLADGTPACMIAGNIVTAAIDGSLTTAPGNVKLSIVLRSADGGQVATFPITMRVAKRPGRTSAEEMAPVSAYAGMLLYGGPNGEVLPLKLGPGLSIRDGVLYVTGGSGAPAQVVTVSVDEGRALRVWLDGEEVIPVIDEAGSQSWPGLDFIIDADGVATLSVKEV